MYVIKIKTHNNHGCWLRSFYNGDPDRTLIKESALKFPKLKAINGKIKMLKKKYPNRNFSVDIY
jgi:hypothetical protein